MRRRLVPKCGTNSPASESWKRRTGPRRTRSRIAAETNFWPCCHRISPGGTRQLTKEPALAHYLNVNAGTPRFKNPDVIPPMDRLSPQAVTALDTLGQYCSRGPVGTPQAILMENFGLSKVQ